MQGEEGARRDEGRKEKKAALGPEVSFFPRGASYVFLYPLDQYILYLAFILLTPYHSICSWWHQETYPRLPKRRLFTIFGDLWCICQSSQQARPYQKNQDRPQKLKNCAVYATTTPSVQLNRFLVPTFLKTSLNIKKMCCLRYYNPQ